MPPQPGGLCFAAEQGLGVPCFCCECPHKNLWCCHMSEHCSGDGGGTCPFEAAFGVWGAGIASLVPGARGVVAARQGRGLQWWLCRAMAPRVPQTWDGWVQWGRALHAGAGSSPLPKQAATRCRCGTGTTCRVAR